MVSFVSNILVTAAKTIDGRAADRDLEQERSMAATVTAFNAIFGTNLTESQGWAFMQVLKIKRSAVGPYKEDDFVDLAAYAALGAEARLAEHKAQASPQINGLDGYTTELVHAKESNWETQPAEVASDYDFQAELEKSLAEVPN